MKYGHALAIFFFLFHFHPTVAFPAQGSGCRDAARKLAGTQGAVSDLRAESAGVAIGADFMLSPDGTKLLYKTAATQSIGGPKVGQPMLLDLTKKGAKPIPLNPKLRWNAYSTESLESKTTPAHAAAFAPGGELLAVAEMRPRTTSPKFIFPSDRLSLVDTKTGEVNETFDLPKIAYAKDGVRPGSNLSPRSISAMTFDESGRYLMVQEDRGHHHVLDTKSGKWQLESGLFPTGPTNYHSDRHSNIGSQVIGGPNSFIGVTNNGKTGFIYPTGKSTEKGQDGPVYFHTEFDRLTPLASKDGTAYFGQPQGRPWLEGGQNEYQTSLHRLSSDGEHGTFRVLFTQVDKIVPSADGKTMLIIGVKTKAGPVDPNNSRERELGARTYNASVFDLATRQELTTKVIYKNNEGFDLDRPIWAPIPTVDAAHTPNGFVVVAGDAQPSKANRLSNTTVLQMSGDGTELLGKVPTLDPQELQISRDGKTVVLNSRFEKVANKNGTGVDTGNVVKLKFPKK